MLLLSVPTWVDGLHIADTIAFLLDKMATGNLVTFSVGNLVPPTVLASSVIHIIVLFKIVLFSVFFYFRPILPFGDGFKTYRIGKFIV